MIVLDASAAVELFVDGPEAERVAGALAYESVIAPAHFDTEVYSAVRRMLRARTISLTLAERALLELARLPAERSPITPLLAESFVYRDRFGAHDVFYAVLARQTGTRLLTIDASFARACQGYVPVVNL